MAQLPQDGLNFPPFSGGDGNPALPTLDWTKLQGPMAQIAQVLQSVQDSSQAQGGVGGNPVQQILAGIPTNKRDLAIQGAAALVPGMVGKSLVKYAPQLSELSESVLANLKGTFSPTSPLKPTYFSNVEDAFSNSKIPAKLSREQAQAVLKSPGVKSEENKWLGMDEFLRGKDKFTKDEILQHIRDHQIDVHEVSSTENSPGFRSLIEWARQQGFDSTPDPNLGHPIFTDQATGRQLTLPETGQLVQQYQQVRDSTPTTKYGKYTLPGGSNYREVLLKWGNKPQKARLPDPFNTSDSEFEQGMDAWRQGDTPEAPRDFQSSHFDDPNILAHLRLTDRVTPEGKKLLFLEEAQSDWQKALRKQDVGAQDPKTSWEYQASKILHDKGLGEHAPMSQSDMEHAASDEGQEMWKVSQGKGNTPDAPLARDYPSLVMKRVLRMASEQGYDGVGWTTGQQQADRYKQQLLGNISDLHYHPAEQSLSVFGPDGKGQVLQVPVSQLANTVGRDTAQKLLEGVTIREPDPSVKDAMMDAWHKTNTLTDPRARWDAITKYESLADQQRGGIVPGHVSGTDMTIGERGYKDVYDTTLPKVADRLGRQFGARTQPGSILAGVDRSGNIGREKPNVLPIHTIPVTPTLRSSALTRGFSLFQHALTIGGAGAAASALYQKYLDSQKKSQSPTN